MPKQSSTSYSHPHHKPSTPRSMPSAKAFDRPHSPSTPRLTPKLRLTVSGSSPAIAKSSKPKPASLKKRGQKRQRDKNVEESSPEGKDEDRPKIKLKFRNPNVSASQYSSSSSSSSTNESQPALTVAPTWVTFFPSFPPLASSSSRMDIDKSRSSTPTLEGPSTKRPRSHSSPSRIVGLVFNVTDTAPSSPNESTSTSIAHGTPTTPTMSAAKLSHPPRVSSPLASRLTLTLSSDSTTSTSQHHSYNRAILESSPSRDIDMDVHGNIDTQLTPGPIDNGTGNNGDSPKNRLMKARHKLHMAEVEALGTEMNNVFKLGYGRGMGRAVTAGTRGPSRLRSGLRERVNHTNDDMEIDE